jgi:hypothetical protein
MDEFKNLVLEIAGTEGSSEIFRKFFFSRNAIERLYWEETKGIKKEFAHATLTLTYSEETDFFHLLLMYADHEYTATMPQADVLFAARERYLPGNQLSKSKCECSVECDCSVEWATETVESAVNACTVGNTVKLDRGIQHEHLWVTRDGLYYSDVFGVKGLLEWRKLYNLILQDDKVYASGESVCQLSGYIWKDFLVIKEMPYKERFCFRVPIESVRLLAEHYLLKRKWV